MENFNQIDIDLINNLITKLLVEKKDFILYQEHNPGHRSYYDLQGDFLEVWVMTNDQGNLEVRSHREWDEGSQETSTILGADDTPPNWISMVSRIPF